MNDTIVAISTALGVGAISIVRLSGEEVINIVNKIFDKDLTKISNLFFVNYLKKNKKNNFFLFFLL